MTLETGGVTELQQSSCRAATAATEWKLKRSYLSLYDIHAYIHTIQTDIRMFMQTVVECAMANLAWRVAIVKFALEVKSVHRLGRDTSLVAR